MKNQQYLTFHCRDFQYGIEAELVQEVFPLPELTSITQSPTEMIDSVNLRGKLVPILHLNLLQEHYVNSCDISDYIIVLQEDNLQFGIVVSQVNEVIEMSNERIKTELQDGLIGDVNTALISGLYLGDSGIILLLNSQGLARQLDVVLPLIWDTQMQMDVVAESPTNQANLTPSVPLIQAERLEERLIDQDGDDQLQTTQIVSNFYDLYCPNATSEERAIFRQRANNLKQQTESSKVIKKLMPMAVIGWGDEYYGLDLELVRAFTNISNLTPIPCCPKHIVGNMNLRGEIVTLVDIRDTFNLPITPIRIGSNVVVVQVDDIVAGLPVDQVLEMVYLDSDQMTSLSGIMPDCGEQYLQGTASFQEKNLKVLDLPKIFTQGGLVVNEDT